MERIAQCHCANLRVAVDGDPEWVNLCHCEACQRRPGGLGHAEAYFHASRVRIEGVSRIHWRTADSGFDVYFHFCPDCGSNVYWMASRFPRHYGIAVGTFAGADFPWSAEAQQTDRAAWSSVDR
jgi:hypothetical protein